MKIINLNSSAARKAIRQEYGNSKNFFTQEIIGYATISRGALYCEVSKGEGIFGGSLYGISVVQKNKDGSTTRRIDLSKALENMAQVYSEIEAMQEMFS